jgi:hypothetical protein
VTCAALLLAAVPAVRADDKEARDLVEKAVKAHGGADKIDKYPAVVIKSKGTVHVMGMDLEYTATQNIQVPDRMRMEIEFTIMGKDFKLVHLFNKDKAWTAFNGEVLELKDDGVKEFEEQMHVGKVNRLAPLLKDKEFKLSSLGESKVGDKEAVGVRVEYKGKRDVNLYFDKKTSMLLKSETRSKDVMSGEEFNAETFLSDWKDKDGLPVAHKVEVKRDGKAFVEAEVIEYKGEDKLDDELFKKP